MFNAEDEKGVFCRVQTRGGGPAGKQWPPADAGRDRGGYLAIDVAKLASSGWWGYDAIEGGDAGVLPLPSPADQASEITRLKRELDRTRMERDVLKKAIGIFAEVPRRASDSSAIMTFPRD